MTQAIDSIVAAANSHDVVVLDQWGVLHDGTNAYPGAVAALQGLKANGHKLAVLSNSGKRASYNADRIASMGFDANLFEIVMTSGEALWLDIQAKRVAKQDFFAIEQTAGDAKLWAADLEINFCDDVRDAQAILLMGLAKFAKADEWQAVTDHALSANLPVYCSNPDRVGVRSGGRTSLSPGTVAYDYQSRGGEVVFYGKPYEPIYKTLQTVLGASRPLMVGDSLEHDIAGANNVGWSSVLVQAGIYAKQFADGDKNEVLAQLCAQHKAPAPTYMMEILK